jgi:diaminopimelate epimerase
MGLAVSPVVVHLLGGDLTIEVAQEPETAGGAKMRVYMTGPAEEVFTAEVSDEVTARLGWS